MKIVADGKDLSDALKRVGRVVPKKELIPILSTVRISALSDSDAFITITASNMDLQIDVRCAAQIIDEGACCPHYATLARAVSPKGGEVTITAHDDKPVRVESGKGWVEVGAMLAADFPNMVAEAGEGTEVDTATWADAMAFCAPSMDSTEHRYYLRGIHVDPRDGELRLEATDGHTLHRATLAKHSGLTEGIIPADAIPVIEAALREGCNRLCINDRYWHISGETTSAAGKMVDGQFPPTDRLFPDGSVVAFQVDGPDIVDRLSTFALDAQEKKSRAVILRTKGGELTVSPSQRGAGFSKLQDAVLSIPAEVKSDGETPVSSVLAMRTFGAFDKVEVSRNDGILTLRDAQESVTFDRRAVVMGMR